MLQLLQVLVRAYIKGASPVCLASASVTLSMSFQEYRLRITNHYAVFTY